MAKGLREEMPETAAFIDACRDAFGTDEINASIKAGLQGKPNFYASENGKTIGTPAPPARLSFSLAEMGIQPPPCDGCVSMQKKQVTPNGNRLQAWCVRYKTTAVSKCADWRAK